MSKKLLCALLITVFGCNVVNAKPSLKSDDGTPDPSTLDKINTVLLWGDPNVDTGGKVLRYSVDGVGATGVVFGGMIVGKGIYNKVKNGGFFQDFKSIVPPSNEVPSTLIRNDAFGDIRENLVRLNEYYYTTFIVNDDELTSSELIMKLVYLRSVVDKEALDHSDHYEMFTNIISDEAADRLFGPKSGYIELENKIDDAMTIKIEDDPEGVVELFSGEYFYGLIHSSAVETNLENNEYLWKLISEEAVLNSHFNDPLLVKRYKQLVEMREAQNKERTEALHDQTLFSPDDLSELENEEFIARLDSGAFGIPDRLYQTRTSMKYDTFMGKIKESQSIRRSLKDEFLRNKAVVDNEIVNDSVVHPTLAQNNTFIAQEHFAQEHLNEPKKFNQLEDKSYFNSEDRGNLDEGDEEEYSINNRIYGIFDEFDYY